MGSIALAFLPDPLLVPTNQLLPSRKLEPGISSSRKFRQIRNSIKEIGLIEPLSVTDTGDRAGGYLILDGHVRQLIMKELGYDAIPCLLATDDEGYTYNSRINRLSTIQEHRMICRAIERGVTPEKLARALNVDVYYINRKARLLDGICDKAAELLNDFQFPLEVAKLLRKMKPERQIECVELMVSANRVTEVYAKALLAATPEALLVCRKKLPRTKTLTREQMTKMEAEMGSLQRQYKTVEKTYGQDILNLVFVRGYLVKVLENRLVVKYLGEHYPDILSQFEAVVKTTSLE